MSPERKAFIEACQQCMTACAVCLDFCLGKPEMEDCAKLCRDCLVVGGACTTLLASGSEHAKALCNVCANLCQDCADECSKHDNDHCRQCAKACRTCIEEYSKMA